MNPFFAAVAGFFAAITNFSTTTRIVLKKIVDLLVAQKARITTIGGIVSGIQATISGILDTLASLSQVKGNYDVLPYDYSADTNPSKPVAGVDAEALFAYVLAKLNLTPVLGKTYKVEFSGEESIPLNVDGVAKSGDPTEGLMVIIAENGQRSHVYQSNLDAEYFKAIKDNADSSKTEILAAQGELNTVHALLDAMIAADATGSNPTTTNTNPPTGGNSGNGIPPSI